MPDPQEVARLAAEIRGDGDTLRAEVERLRAEVAAQREQIHGLRGLYYGACAARTEHAHALGLARLRIAQLEARVMRAEGQG